MTILEDLKQAAEAGGAWAWLHLQRRDSAHLLIQCAERMGIEDEFLNTMCDDPEVFSEAIEAAEALGL